MNLVMGKYFESVILLILNEQKKDTNNAHCFELNYNILHLIIATT
jgi:hypothetical protein